MAVKIYSSQNGRDEYFVCNHHIMDNINNNIILLLFFLLNIQYYYIIGGAKDVCDNYPKILCTRRQPKSLSKRIQINHDKALQRRDKVNIL